MRVREGGGWGLAARAVRATQALRVTQMSWRVVRERSAAVERKVVPRRVITGKGGELVPPLVSWDQDEESKDKDGQMDSTGRVCLLQGTKERIVGEFLSGTGAVCKVLGRITITGKLDDDNAGREVNSGITLIMDAIRRKVIDIETRRGVEKGGDGGGKIG